MTDNKEPSNSKNAEIGQTYYILGFVFTIIGLTNFAFFPIGVVFLALAFNMYPEYNPFASKKDKEKPVDLDKHEDKPDLPE